MLIVNRKGFLCGPLRISAFSASKVRRKTQRAQRYAENRREYAVVLDRRPPMMPSYAHETFLFDRRNFSVGVARGGVREDLEYE